MYVYFFVQGVQGVAAPPFPPNKQNRAKQNKLKHGTLQNMKQTKPKLINTSKNQIYSLFSQTMVIDRDFGTGMSTNWDVHFFPKIVGCPGCPQKTPHFFRAYGANFSIFVTFSNPVSLGRVPRKILPRIFGSRCRLPRFASCFLVIFSAYENDNYRQDSPQSQPSTARCVHTVGARFWP